MYVMGSPSSIIINPLPPNVCYGVSLFHNNDPPPRQMHVSPKNNNKIKALKKKKKKKKKDIHLLTFSR